MHIVIAVITALAGLIWALNSLQRSGFDLNSLNPFYWARRRQWANKQINPLYSIETPRELAALLMFAVLRQGGDPTEEQKAHLLALYTDELHFGAQESTEMYSLASHLIHTDPNYMHKVPDLMRPSLAAMTTSQIESIPALVRQIATFSGTANATQVAFMESIDSVLSNLHK